MNELFCIECGKMVHAERGAALEHLVTVKAYSGGGDVGDKYDVESCYFPLGYAFVPPPADLPEGWQDELSEPGEDVIEPELEVELPVVVEV